MAQLIVLLEKDFKNTLKYRSTKNIILSHGLISNIQNARKSLKVKNTKNRNHDTEVIEILPKDIDSASEGEYGEPSFCKVKIENHFDSDTSCDNINDKLSKTDLNMTKPSTKPVMASKEIKEDLESDSEADPFGDNSDDDSDYKVSINKKTKKNSQSFTKRKKTNSPKKNRERNREGKHSDESDYVPEEEADSDNSDEVDSDWNKKQTPLKKRNKQEVDCDSNKSMYKKLLEDSSYYACTKCGAKIQSASEKDRHRKSHNLRYLAFRSFYQCPDCAFKCSHSNTFRVHYQKHHSNVSGYFAWKKCTECPYKTNANISLRRHIKRHVETGTFKCEYCTFTHDHKKNVTRHLRLHNKFLTGIFRCEECSYATKHSSSMFKHKKMYHTPEEERKWIYCKECPFKCMEYQNLKKHIKCHQVEDGYKCPHCTYASPSACRVTDHIKIHYAKGQPIPDYDPKMQNPLHSCTKCSYKTMSKVHLDRHLAAHKTYKDRRINCAECPFTCKDKIDLVTHVKWHNGEGDLKCPWCSFTHFAPQVMTRHKRLHNDERESIEKTKIRRKGEPRCPICNELFKAPSFVRRHMTKHQTIDQVENPVLCANCPYKSKSKGRSFINHIQCHFNNEGLKCDFCTFRHDRQNVMTTHVKLHKEASVKTESE